MKLKTLSCMIIAVILSFNIIPASAYSTYDDIYSQTGKYLSSKTPETGSLGGEWLVFGLARSEYPVPDNYYDHYYESVTGMMIDSEGILTSNKYSEYSKLIIALTSIGKNITDVGGYNLLEYLSDYSKIIKQGVNGAIFALLALDCAKYPIPESVNPSVQTSREYLIEYILDKELNNGGWALSGSVPDSDVTAMAIQALAPYSHPDIKSALNRGIETLSSIQTDNGAYASSGIQNAESTAQVLTALSVLKINPYTDERFIKNGNTVVSALMDFYNGDGTFCHIKGSSSNQMATEQAFYAMTALNRYENNKTSVYDMSDVFYTAIESVSEENITIFSSFDTSCVMIQTSIYSEPYITHLNLKKGSNTYPLHEGTAKIMLWQNIQNMIPLCSAYTVI